MRRRLFLALALAAPLTLAPSGEFNKKVSIGDPAPRFEKLPAADGKSYSLADFADRDVLVLVVTCNHCPIAVAYEDRIIAFAKKYASNPGSKVALVALNVNNNEADRLPRMTERAKDKGFTFPYLYDESQELGRALGATVTPEFFVFDRDRKIVYMGAMDDDLNRPKTDYLSLAVEAALQGAVSEKPETRARGCSVQYEQK